MQQSNNPIPAIFSNWLDMTKNDKKTFDELKSIENDEKRNNRQVLLRPEIRHRRTQRQTRRRHEQNE